MLRQSLIESIYNKKEGNPQKMYTKDFYVSDVKSGCGGPQKKNRSKFTHGKVVNFHVFNTARLNFQCEEKNSHIQIRCYKNFLEYKKCDILTSDSHMSIIVQCYFDLTTAIQCYFNNIRLNDF